MAEHQQEKAARLTWAALEKHKLTVNAASLRWNLARPTITKMTMGNRVELNAVEEFARRAGEDVNEFREAFGYEPVTDNRSYFAEGLRRIEEKVGAPLLGIGTSLSALDKASKEEIDRLLERIFRNHSEDYGQPDEDNRNALGGRDSERDPKEARRG